ncbi:hypothetical protein GEMRC1_005528 [Eukaryota sp. GEM-RC1]
MTSLLLAPSDVQHPLQFFSYRFSLKELKFAFNQNNAVFLLSHFFSDQLGSWFAGSSDFSICVEQPQLSVALPFNPSLFLLHFTSKFTINDVNLPDDLRKVTLQQCPFIFEVTTGIFAVDKSKAELFVCDILNKLQANAPPGCDLEDLTTMLIPPHLL